MRVTTVLLVEDEDAVRTVTRRILERAGFHVVEARSGREGLAFAEDTADPVDILITDLHLPDLDGADVAREFTRRQPAARVLYLSGDSGESLPEHGILEAGENFVQKPFTSEVLLDRVRHLLSTP